LTCGLDYIPKHLHTKDKPLIEEFYEGEKLFYRCKEGECEKPYNKKRLYDISHNRNFCEENTYKKDDVLYNVIENDPEERYQGLNIAELKIVNLNGSFTYIKTIEINKELSAIIKLKHAPIPCMYPHSVFEISVNDVVVTPDNYKTVLDKGSKMYKNLRTSIRQELSSMIQSGSIDSDEEVEIINEP